MLRFLDSWQTGRQIPILFKNATQVDIAVAYMKNDGVALLRKPLMQLLKRGGRTRIVIAVDPFGITDGSAVATLYTLLSKYPVQARIRYYRDNAFHPKLYVFKYGNKTVAIVGSSNLTRAAMESNIEANLLIEGEPNEPTIATVTDYYDRVIWDPCQGKLSGEILSELRRYDRVKPSISATHVAIQIPPSRIAKHPRSRVRRARRAKRAPIAARGALPDTVVIRYIPRASGRVAQVHFTREIIEKFFRLRLGTREPIIIQQKQPGERFKRIERRTLIYSMSNKNPKIEVDGAKILEDNYPASGRPIIVLHALKNRRYRYMIRLPGDDGHRKLAKILDLEPRKGLALPFKITDAGSLKQMWAGYR